MMSISFKQQIVNYFIDYKKLFRNVGIYTFGDLINAAIPFFLLPIFTRYLSPNDYGVIATFNVMIAIMGPFIGLRLFQAIARNFYKMNKEQRSIYIGNCIIIIFISFFIIFLITLLLKRNISSWAVFPDSPWILCMPVIALCSAIVTIYLTILRFSSRASAFVIFQFMMAIVNAGVSLYLIILIGMGWTGRLIGITVTWSIFSPLALIILYKSNLLKFKHNSRVIKESLKYSVPLVPHALAGWVRESADRLFINNMISVSTAGVYTAGLNICRLTAMFSMAFNKAYTPYLYEKLEMNSIKERVKIVKFTYAYFVLFVLGGILLVFLINELIPVFLDSRYHGAIEFVPWLVFSGVFDAMYSMVVTLIFYSGKTYLVTAITISLCIVNVILNYFMIKLNGAVGAAQATCIIGFLSFVSCWAVSTKVFKMPWCYWKTGLLTRQR